MNTMTDDYGLPSLYVKRVPHSIHSEGAAMTCYESYMKRKHDETPAWDACETVHDKRSSEDYLRVSRYVDSNGRLVALGMKPEMLAFMDDSMPFIYFNQDVYVVGRHLAVQLEEKIKKVDTMLEVLCSVDLDFMIEDWGPVILNEMVRDSDTWYKIKELIENCDPQRQKLALMQKDMRDGDNHRYPLAQRIAVARFDMRYKDYNIMGISDGAIMMNVCGMVVGIELDGYTHS